MNHLPLQQAFDGADEQIVLLEQAISAGQAMPLTELVAQSIQLVRQLIVAYIVDVGEADLPADSDDLLAVFKLLVKGDPSWNTIRDNCRELVYYQNCLLMDRADALPAQPDKTAVRTLRHIYLFMKSRCLREARLEMV